MLAVEILEPLAENVWLVFVGFDRFLVQLLLCLAGGDQAVFRHVVTKAVGRLRVLAGGLQVRVSHGVAEFLEIRVRACFQMFV